MFVTPCTVARLVISRCGLEDFTCTWLLLYVWMAGVDNHCMVSDCDKLGVFGGNMIRGACVCFKSITHYIMLIDSRLQNYLRLKISRIFFNCNIHSKYMHYTLINHSSHKKPFPDYVKWCHCKMLWNILHHKVGRSTQNIEVCVHDFTFTCLTIQQKHKKLPGCIKLQTQKYCIPIMKHNTKMYRV